MKIYIAIRFISESQCPPDSTEIIDVFSTKEKARKCIEEESEHVREYGRNYKDSGDSICGSIGDFYYEYYIEEKESK